MPEAVNEPCDHSNHAQIGDPVPVGVRFEMHGAGWAYLHFEVGEKTVAIHLSECYDPFKNMLEWHDQIASAQFPAEIYICEECQSKTLIVDQPAGSGASCRFRILNYDETPLVEVLVDPTQLREAFGRALAAFFEGEFILEDWDRDRFGNEVVSIPHALELETQVLEHPSLAQFRNPSCSEPDRRDGTEPGWTGHLMGPAPWPSGPTQIQVADLALGRSPLAMTLWLRDRADHGEDLDQVLAQARRFGIHPLSLAVAKTAGYGGLVERRDMNRAFWTQCGGDPAWTDAIEGNGLRLRDDRHDHLPEGLVLPQLELCRLRHPITLPWDLQVQTLAIYRCPWLTHMPLLPSVRTLALLDLPGLQSIAPGFALDDLLLVECPTIEEVPGMGGPGDRVFSIGHCRSLRRIPRDLRCGELFLSHLPCLTQVPEAAGSFTSFVATACPGIEPSRNPSSGEHGLGQR